MVQDDSGALRRTSEGGDVEGRSAEEIAGAKEGGCVVGVGARVELGMGSNGVSGDNVADECFRCAGYVLEDELKGTRVFISGKKKPWQRKDRERKDPVYRIMRF